MFSPGPRGVKGIGQDLSTARYATSVPRPISRKKSQ